MLQGKIRSVLVAILAALAFSWPAIADARGHRSGGSVSVRGYYRKDGTYVRPHMRSAPDGDFSNNWSTRGNVNPYTGAPGTKTSPSNHSSRYARTTARTSYRTSARSTARRSYQSGALNAEADDDGQPVERRGDDREAGDSPDEPPTKPPLAPEPAAPELPTRYIAHFSNGKSRALTDFALEENGCWILFPVTGGSIGGYTKAMVAYFEPTLDAIGTMRKWTDSAGSHHATAKFVRIDGEKVVLTKDDGKTIRVPLNKLSEADQGLAQKLQELVEKQ